MTKVKLHIHVAKEEKLLVNPELINLLRIIQKTGNLLTVFEQMNVSYNKAWKIPDAMNTVFQVNP